ncbi:MAG: hypothetical protein V4459_01250 [Pseudomonadota bacterium]
MSTNPDTSTAPETPRKIDISALTVPKREQPPEAAVAPPVPATTSQTDPGKGGKGGKEGEPPLPLSNAVFLENVVRDVAGDARAVICSKPGDPTDGGWVATVATDPERQCPPDQNNYFNCSSFTTDETGGVSATNDRFSGYHVLVLDDVGTKVDRGKLGDFQPTWEIETSPGNSQIGIRLREPIRDPEAVTRLQSAIKAAGLCDAGAGGLARWMRLPVAINGKAANRDDDGNAFRCRLTVWNPGTDYTADELFSLLKLDLSRPQVKVQDGTAQRAVRLTSERGNDVFTPKPSENPVLTALRDRSLYKRVIAPGKHDVTCPWVDEHTDKIDGGAAYFEPDENHPLGGFDCKHSHGDQYHIGQLLDFLGIKPEKARCKARIDVVAGEMNRVRRAAEMTLALRGGYYQAGGAIVVIRTDPGTKDISTELLTEAPLTAALADAADWYRFDGRAQASVRTDPPAKNVQTLLRAQQLDHLPALTGLARQPFFREEDGELVKKPGYDKVTGRFAAFDAAQFVIPGPTEEAAREALAVMDSLLDEFRFATPADRSAALCAMLTAAVRPSLPVAPAFNITASTPGSGKSYLASTILPFAGPGAALKISYPTSADEATKAMLSIFLGAPAAVLFDDMQGQWMPYGAINRALTSDTITDRVLGVSRTVTVSTRSLIMGTGNNVGPIRDMTRRVVTIRLHHKTATPALEKYDGRPADLVRENRGKYVSAALTIIAAWRAAGSLMADVPSIASYGVWSEMCRQPLLWLGLPDPATSIIDQLLHDPDQDDLGRLLGAWHAAVGEKAIMLRDLIIAGSDDPGLEDALLDLPVVDRDVINRSKLGWYLKRNANRVVAGFELQAAECSSRNAWRVVKIDIGGDPPA